jgi:hypothetical protein
MSYAEELEGRLDAITAWPTVREQVKQMVRVARKKDLSRQARFVLVSEAVDIVIALHLDGHDVRWLLRYAAGTYERMANQW